MMDTEKNIKKCYGFIRDFKQHTGAYEKNQRNF